MCLQTTFKASQSLLDSNILDLDSIDPRTDTIYFSPSAI